MKKWLHEVWVVGRRFQFVILGVIVLAVPAAIFASQYFTSSTGPCAGPAVYTNPEINCYTDDQLQSATMIKGKVQEYIDGKKDDADIDRISVFFRDLNTKRWFGINENAEFPPGSLLKMAIAVTYFKYSEIDPGIMSETLTYSPGKQSSANAYQSDPPSNLLQAGQAYAVSDLIYRMLAYSDNDAAIMLYGAVDKNLYNQVMIDLGIRTPAETPNSTEDYLSAKVLGSIIRSLYNASYLEEDASEKMLGIMTEATFKNALVSGVPPGVAVAHKYGERLLKGTDEDGGDENVLHDCGIVYKANDPYILCVMTQGDGNVHDKLEGAISDISKIVYDNIQI